LQRRRELPTQHCPPANQIGELYAERLIADGKVTAEDHEEMKAEVIARLTSAQGLAKEMKPRPRNVSLGPAWRGMTKAPAFGEGQWQAKTAVPRDVLAHVVKNATNVPGDFTPHPKIKRVLAARQQMIETGKGVDWGGAEQMAMGSLLLEGHWVRLMGQDVERGTFSHRHAILYDYDNGFMYMFVDAPSGLVIGAALGIRVFEHDAVPSGTPVEYIEAPLGA